jgi:hypothetical protein
MCRKLRPWRRGRRGIDDQKIWMKSGGYAGRIFVARSPAAYRSPCSSDKVLLMPS